VAAGPRVLLVNDSADEVEMYGEWLRRQGYRTLHAANAVDGYRMAIELRPVVIITDIKLEGPDNGFLLTRRLKKTSSTAHVPIIILSGYTLQGAAEAASGAGCDRFLMKPCLPDALSEAIDQLLQRPPSGSALSDYPLV
jgi:CheY-like chemotaxis protein